MFTGGERERVDYRLCSRVGREEGWTTDCVHGWGERKGGWHTLETVQGWRERKGGRHTLETVFRGGERGKVDDVH